MCDWSSDLVSSDLGGFFPSRGKGDSPPPLFVTYYSCTGFLRGGVGDEWPLDSMAESGISAICIKTAPYRTDAAMRYGLGLSAGESLFARLAATAEIARARVGMGGRSFGPQVPMWTPREPN